MIPARPRAGLATVMVLALLTTAACHGTDGAAGPSSTAGSATGASSTAPGGGTSSTDEPTDELTPGTVVPSFPTGTGATSAAPRSTCTSLRIAVLRGSGAPGQQFAALQFTNTGSSTCVLHGYPVVALQLAGKAVGSPSTPAGTATSTRTLAPGAVAQAGLHDYVTNCAAPLSDTATVVAPGSSVRASQAITLRACTLRVDPLGAPS